MTGLADNNPPELPSGPAAEPSATTTAQPIFNAPTVVLVAIAVLALIHLGLQWAGQDWQIWALYAFSFIPARFGPEPFPQLPGSAYWSLITYGLLHGGWMHLIFNCLWLLIFSVVVARRLGTLGYLSICVLSTIGGGLASLALHWGERTIMVGASSAVSGLMAAAMPIMFSKDMRLGETYRQDLSAVVALRPVELLRNSRALSFGIIWLGITLFTGAMQLTGVAFLDETLIAWEAHLGGFVIGLVAFYALDRGNALRPQKL